MKKFSSIIFDLGGVLIDWNPEYLYRKIFSREEEMHAFLSEVCTPDWNEEQDGGRTLKEATELLVGNFPKHEQNIRAYYGRWEEMLKGPVEGTVEILKQLKESDQYDLYALTNWSAETFPVALGRYEFLHWFHGKIVSGEEKIRKPFPEIYKLILYRFHIDPLKAIYIDDNERNLKAPRELGIHCIHFTSPAALKAELIALEILPG